LRLTGLLPVLALAATLASVPSGAQYPARPIRLVVPFTAGGVTDSVARITANHISKSLGQPVVVENRPGADGAIAAQTVKAAAPDGYTLLFATNSVLSVPLVSKTAGFDTFADFVPVSTVGRFPFALFVHPDVPSKSVKELVDYARANPGKLNYATVNPGEQLITGQFIKATGVDMVRIPYKGGAAALPDLVAGRIQVYFTPVGNGVGHAREGRVRMLATLLPERTPLAPEVPTMTEAGVAGISVMSYQMILAPAGTPPELVERLSAEVNAAVRDPGVRAQLEKVSLVVEGMTPQQTAKMIAEADRAWAQFFREAGISAQ
jgi:tripartite-type tricarboxylate transporter receptor subunit TctC